MCIYIYTCAVNSTSTWKFLSTNHPTWLSARDPVLLFHLMFQLSNFRVAFLHLQFQAILVDMLDVVERYKNGTNKKKNTYINI